MQRFHRSTKCENKYKLCTIEFSPKLVHVLPPSVELWKLRFYKESNISILLSNIVTLSLLFSKLSNDSNYMDSRYKIIAVYIK